VAGGVITARWRLVVTDALLRGAISTRRSTGGAKVRMLVLVDGKVSPGADGRIGLLRLIDGALALGGEVGLDIGDLVAGAEGGVMLLAGAETFGWAAGLAGAAGLLGAACGALGAGAVRGVDARGAAEVLAGGEALLADAFDRPD